MMISSTGSFGRDAQTLFFSQTKSQRAAFPAGVIPYLQRTGLSTNPFFFNAAISSLTTFLSRPVAWAISFEPQGPSHLASASNINLDSPLLLLPQLQPQPHPLICVPPCYLFYFDIPGTPRLFPNGTRLPSIRPQSQTS